MARLGGSIFVHNAVKFDYCIEESIHSLCELCDQVVALDAQSDDNTVDVLMNCEKKFKNLKVFTNATWECADNYQRLAILANQAKNYLNTPWHFMLQADEVIHESSFDYIRRAVNGKKYESYFCRRYNFFKDFNHYLRFNLPQDKKPCSDVVVRLARIGYNAVGDAESLGVDPKNANTSEPDRIKIFHYGMVRKDQNYIDKTISMQSWFMGEGSQPDPRVVAMTNGVYEWNKMKELDDLTTLQISHPIFAQKWVEERQGLKPE